MTYNSAEEACARLQISLGDAQMKKLYQTAFRLATQDVSILLSGPTGVGKDTLARFIHTVGARSAHSFVQMNCSAIPSSLFESEMFGYASGAFTGARKRGKKGLAEVAHKGTLFIDEISELSLQNQVKLLRFAQSQEIQTIAAGESKTVDVRLISASNRDLKEMIEEKSFRQDLYYRICVAELSIPPLCKRPADIHALALDALTQYVEKFHIEKSLTPDAVQYLQAQPWSGNVRQLLGYLQQLCIMDTPSEIDRAYLEARFPVRDLFPEGVSSDAGRAIRPLKEALAAYEKEYIEATIKECGNLAEAARRLEIPLSTLNRKKKALGIYKYRRYEE